MSTLENTEKRDLRLPSTADSKTSINYYLQREFEAVPELASFIDKHIISPIKRICTNNCFTFDELKAQLDFIVKCIKDNMRTVYSENIAITNKNNDLKDTINEL